MGNQTTAADIAATILDGFDDYREHFRRITDGAALRFAKAQWQQAQQCSATRISLYEEKVAESRRALHSRFNTDILLDLSLWPQVKSCYVERIGDHLDDDLSETWFNSVFFRLFDNEHIDDSVMFVNSTRPEPRPSSRSIQTQCYHRPSGDLSQLLYQILADYPLGLPWKDLDGDVQRLAEHLRQSLPEWVCRDSETTVEMFSSVLYRNKGAYLVGRLFTPEEQWPLVIAFVHKEGDGEGKGGGAVADAILTDVSEVSIIFSFTRSYFMADVPVPAEFVTFLKNIMPGKSVAELYTSLGFYKHGKSEFYRSLVAYLKNTDDRFIMAPGVRGMVMSVFTLPGFTTVFKIIKDRFSPSKTVDRNTVIDRYRLVRGHDRVGRLADTQEFSDFRFPREKFDPDCLQELLDVAPSTVELEDENTVLVKHCWIERRMVPLNIYLETASEAKIREALQDYGLAIKELAAANIFPGDMLLKNFGVTRHGRVVFYDYDEISYLTEVNFRHIPPPRYPEDEMASEPWYSVGPNDVFPEEFPNFLFADIALRRMFSQMHGNLYDADYWKSLQDAIRAGVIIDVFPYQRQSGGAQTD